MNRSAIYLLLIAGAFALCSTAFSGKSAVAVRSIVAPPTVPLATPFTVAAPATPTRKRLKMETLLRPDQTLYYWYSWPYDTYNDRKTLNDEIWEMWFYYAALVDTNPSGGILIERGYNNGNYPHSLLPYYFLYVHYVYE